MPEALIASNLSPEEFGNYYATGAFRRNCDPAIFFEIDPNFKSDYLPIDKIPELCAPHPDGRPHKSVCLSVYRVLEHVPMPAFKNLYLVTSDGKTLELTAKPFEPDPSRKVYLYQDLAPCRPRVASILNPQEYVKRLTSPERLVHFKKIAFFDMKLGDLERDPVNGDLGDLPYTNQHHLRDCLDVVRTKGGKNNKIDPWARFYTGQSEAAFMWAPATICWRIRCRRRTKLRQTTSNGLRVRSSEVEPYCGLF